MTSALRGEGVGSKADDSTDRLREWGEGSKIRIFADVIHEWLKGCNHCIPHSLLVLPPSRRVPQVPHRRFATLSASRNAEESPLSLYRGLPSAFTSR